MTWRPYRWDDYNIDLVDSSLVTIGHLNEAHMLAYDWSSFGHGKAVLALHKDSQQALTLLGEEQFYFKVWRAGVHVRDFMVAKDDHGYTLDVFDVDEYIKLICSPLGMVLAQDFCQPETAAGTFETPSLPIDDAFKWIVDHTFGPNAFDSFGGANRTRAGLTIAADLGDHPITQVIDVCDKMNVFEFLQRFGPNWDVDWRLRLEITGGKQNQMVFETFYPRRGLDKTESNYAVRIPVLINDASVNVPRARKYRETASMVNVWVKEDLSGETADAASVAAWGRRAARAATNVSDKLDTLIANKGIEEGQEYGFHPSEQCQLGENDNFVVGDLVTVGNAHVGIAASDQPIKGALIEIAETGEESISLTFGEYEKTLGDKIDEGGGGSPDDFYPDPLHGLRDNADVWVPLSNDDFRIWIKLANVDGTITTVADYATNTITISAVASELCYWKRVGTVLWPDTAGDYVSAVRYQVSNSSNYIALNGTAFMLRCGVRFELFFNASEYYRFTTPALLPIQNGMDLGGVSNYWDKSYIGDMYVAAGEYVTSPSANQIQVVGTNFAGLEAGGEAVWVGASFYGVGNLDLGKAATPWGDIYIATAKGVIHADGNEVGKVLAGDNARFVPTTLSSLIGHAVLSATHTDTVAAGVSRGSMIVGNATPEWMEVTVGGALTYWGSDGTDATWTSPSHSPGAAAAILATDGAGELHIAGKLFLETGTTEYIWQNAASQITVVAANFAILSANSQNVVVGSGFYTPDTITLGQVGNRWGTYYGDNMNITGSITMVASETVDGVDISEHTHRLAYTGTASANANTDLLTGITSSWDVAAYPTTWVSNPVRDSGGTEVYLRTFANAADAANDVNPTGEKGYIGSTPHHHALAGTSGFGTILATGKAAAHTHLYDKTNTPTGTPS